MELKLRLLILVSVYFCSVDVTLQQVQNDYYKTPSETDNIRCSIFETYNESVPSIIDLDASFTPGGEVLSVEFLTIDACETACCELGPSKCQYLLITKGKCLAFWCNESMNELCLPSSFNRTEHTAPGNMTYIKMSYEADTENNTSDARCFASETYNDTLPKEDFYSLPDTAFLNVSDGEECKTACCELGPTKCQYLWIIDGKCIAVYCPDNETDKCLPVNQSTYYETVTYFKMTFENLSIIHPTKRVNSPPVPVILPSQDVTIHLPQNLILDASSSKDDLGMDALTIHWEEVTGPVGDSPHIADTSVMVVNDLQPGHYTFRLTVTDGEGASAEAFVNVTVEPEQDYPPVANVSLSCSGHEFRDPVTKECKCSTFWMENPFKARFGKMERNCEWSVFYVALVGLAVVIPLFFVFLLCCCCCLRKCWMSFSKHYVGYVVLDQEADENILLEVKSSSQKNLTSSSTHKSGQFCEERTRNDVCQMDSV